MKHEESRNKYDRQSKEKHIFFTYVKIDGHIQEVSENTFMKLYSIPVSCVRHLCNHINLLST